MEDNTHAALLDEVVHHKPLSPVPQQSDRSAPFIDPSVHLSTFPKQQLLEEIQKGSPLHHVDDKDRHDASKPVIEDVKIQPSHRGELLQEVRAVGSHHAAMSELKQTFLEQAREGGLPLRHVTTVDKTHVPTDGVTIKQGTSRTDLLTEITHPSVKLHHVDPAQQHDCSAPAISVEGGSGSTADGQQLPASPSKAMRAALLKEVQEAATSPHHGLHAPASPVADRSNPQISKTAAMRVVSPAQQ